MARTKYTVTDPRSTGVWIYEEQADGSWKCTEPENAPTLENSPDIKTTTFIENVVEVHRRRGRVVEVAEVANS